MSIKKELASLPTDDSALRKFGLQVGGVLLAFSALLVFWLEKKWGVYLAWAGAPLVLLGAVWPRILRPVYLGWMGAALAIGSVMTVILLSVFFFVVLTPVGLFFRLIGRDVLQRKLDRQAPTYWIPKEYPIADRTRYEKFF
jgi:hypothetical protein